ncbi:MAG: Asp-tRNA(Asn)/Glu-tRNA(Gln) amidotransferase subunit GatB [Actinobacteria bacterium]|jgi:aspartyl-tRNA(Asn)/glutamyl-tRNA(Gln) amidotransferase subunit B|nr:Asp-tRNA(Asn)/Glu-tRNA(Gln) amidotransferase subunit GatB [Actinomycetota bacterium]
MNAAPTGKSGAAGDGLNDGSREPTVDREAWESVIGLEIHVQLSTQTKMFCGCTVTFGDPPNTHVCPVCLGHPGVLPVCNERAIEYATRIALALDCRIAERTVFHRKNYFYPDLPKAYQISQYDQPLGLGGHLDVELEDGSRFTVGITRAHMEEDAGKLVHAGGASGRIDGADYSLVDFNRGGIPLVEIVTEPDLRTPDQARVFLVQLRSLLQQLGVSDVNMEEGSLRCDANVSIRRPGDPFGTKTELKNMNSFRFLQRGLEAEIERQIDTLEAGETVVQQTVHFDPASGAVSALRSKEEAHDYRYFPEPDLTPIELDAEYVERVRESLPELPAARKERLMEQYSLPAKDAAALAGNKPLGDYFEELAAASGDARTAANWVLGDLSAYLNTSGVEVADCPVKVAPLAELLGLVDDGTLSGKMAKEVFETMASTGKDAKTIVAEEGLGQISDLGELETIVVRIVAANPGPAEEFRQGREKVLGFFVGQVMKETQGQANPQIVNDLLRKQLGASGV